MDTRDEFIQAHPRVLVLGYAREGASVARYLQRLGAEVTAADARFAASGREPTEGTRPVVLSPERVELVRNADVLVVSPGIPDSNPLLTQAFNQGVPVTNATQLFFDRCPCPIVGITGTSGKSTTTSLITAMLQADGRDARAGGNIGLPMIDLLDELTPNSVAVLELSSFQLQRLHASPHVAVVTNLAPNHLDRHGTLQAYQAAKANILRRQGAGDIAVLGWESEHVRAMASETAARIVWFGEDAPTPSATAEAGWILFSDEDVERIMPVEDLRLRGRHNVQNVLAAVAAARALHTSTSAIQSATSGFQGLPHRLQAVGEICGVIFIDDSIATSPDRAAVALDAVSSPIVLIAGGRSKGLPWTPLSMNLRTKAKAVVLIGEAADEIQRWLLEDKALGELHVQRADSMPAAVRSAFGLAEPGDTVLLAPACTSYDMYSNFEERGDAFRAAVEGMIDGD